MPTDFTTYQNSGYFTKIIIDYLDQSEDLKSFYNHFPTIENFATQMSEKSINYDHLNRNIVVDELKIQYQNIKISDLTSQNIELLRQETTYTITTGHQLNLFTGPMYFLYKIISTINLCKELKQQYPTNDFVPIYWMATEDHDFDEINYFNFKELKIRWSKKDAAGPVGRFSTDGLEEVLKIFEKMLGSSENAIYLIKLFRESYLNNSNLANATRVLANALFANEGLIIIDADNHNLKKIFAPYIENELINQRSFNEVSNTILELDKYDIQVNPREINLFYIQDNLRERIILENDIYKVKNTSLIFSKEEIVTELKNYPEKFSPNVILRPLYQEVILPNLCYVGGGGELAYWLELKSMFSTNNITFPLLLLRNSVLILNNKQASKADQLELTFKDLFTKQDELIKQQTIKKSAICISLEKQKLALLEQFEYLHKLAKLTDKSFSGAVIAQEIKQLKGLENLEKRLLKAQKRVLNDFIERIVILQNQLFPKQSLQERQLNFSELYLEHGQLLITDLLKTLKPLENEFNKIIL